MRVSGFRVSEAGFRACVFSGCGLSIFVFGLSIKDVSPCSCNLENRVDAQGLIAVIYLWWQWCCF